MRIGLGDDGHWHTFQDKRMPVNIILTIIVVKSTVVVEHAVCHGVSHSERLCQYKRSKYYKTNKCQCVAGLETSN